MFYIIKLVCLRNSIQEITVLLDAIEKTIPRRRMEINGVDVFFITQIVYVFKNHLGDIKNKAFSYRKRIILQNN